MATFDYSGMLATANSLIARFGRNITIRTKVESGDAWNPSVSWNESTANAVNLPVGSSGGFRLDIRDDDGNNLIQANDRIFLIESSATIDTSSRVLDGGNEYQVVQISHVNPGDTLLLYRVIVRS